MGNLGLTKLRIEVATPLRPIQQDGSHIREEEQGTRRLTYSRAHIQSSGSSKLSNSEVSGKQWYIFYTMLSFEFDQAKSQSNLSKHGISYVDTQRLWNDPWLLEIPARTEGEPRYLVIGRINGEHWSAVITEVHLFDLFLSVDRGLRR